MYQGPQLHQARWLVGQRHGCGACNHYHVQAVGKTVDDDGDVARVWTACGFCGGVDGKIARRRQYVYVLNTVRGCIAAGIGCRPGAHEVPLALDQVAEVIGVRHQNFAAQVGGGRLAGNARVGFLSANDSNAVGAGSPYRRLVVLGL